ncbi:YbaN family protein [Sansalvadorimonas sp. 2012CJ34-2]|uniref:Inner membrane protein n=1 Tax=Parendozoicomonas callyspongiae TaxID=2942213 RepID=A0ABT0PKY0_9GAMM|nr:YbaN family protein [Sansalvadorimonas sp. 2012CJ34-2]MCL6271387.1 YbaN family protein [Sansalvadorimonas sp. 2012CJ34-2]
MRKQLAHLLLILCGWLAVALGIIGIFLPILPTTPFLLLAGFCFVRSSPRFHTWLVNHRHLGSIVKSFQVDQGIPRKIRQRAVITMWASLGLSAFLVGKWWVALVLAVTGTCVTIYLYRFPVMEDTTLDSNTNSTD